MQPDIPTIRKGDLTMKSANIVKTSLLALSGCTALLLGTSRNTAAHCDTLDGPVVQDARKAIQTREISPVLKWVKVKDEKAVRSAFQKVLASGAKNHEAAETAFFGTLVKIHRAGEGAPYTGLKPAGAVEPAVAEADKALASGSSDALVKLISDDVAAGIRKRYEHAAAAYKHKDESVAQGREFVEAYVELTHYVERLHQLAAGKGAHGEHPEHVEGKKLPKHHKQPNHSGH